MGDNWLTPPWLLELLFGDNDYYDPNPGNPEGLRGFDGMGAWPTDRVVFLNPPYSDPAPWLSKASKHRGPIVCLVKSDHSTEWWQRYSPGWRIVRVGQRLRFLNGGSEENSANFPSELWFRGWPPIWSPKAEG
jgi:hypothetical protein